MVSFLVGYVGNYFHYVCMQIMRDQSIHQVRSHSPGMWEQLHQKVELRKAPGLASWEAVSSPHLSLIWNQASLLVDLV